MDPYLGGMEIHPVMDAAVVEEINFPRVKPIEISLHKHEGLVVGCNGKMKANPESGVMGLIMDETEVFLMLGKGGFSMQYIDPKIDRMGKELDELV